MINQNQIKDCLKGQVGIRKSLDTNMPVPSVDLQNPKSGLFLNSVHALISVDNIWPMIKEGGPIKRENGVTDTMLLNEYMVNVSNDAIIKLSNRIYVEKQLSTYSKSVFPDTKLYDSPASVHDTLEKQGRFVGFLIMGTAADISLAIKRFSTQFESENPGLNFYLYKDGVKDPISVLTVDCVKEYYPQWHEVDNVVLSPSESYFFGYYEYDLTGRALNKRISFKKPPCSCEPIEYELWKKWNRNLSIRAMYVDSNSIKSDRTLWGPGDEIYVDDYSWGLNFVFSASCDITSIFCSNKQLLVDALATQTGIMILEEMANSSRENQPKNTLSQKAFYALDNKENNATGLLSQLEQKIRVINLDFGSLNTACLPCHNSGIVFGTIY